MRVVVLLAEKTPVLFGKVSSGLRKLHSFLSKGLFEKVDCFVEKISFIGVSIPKQNITGFLWDHFQQFCQKIMSVFLEKTLREFCLWKKVKYFFYSNKQSRDFWGKTFLLCCQNFNPRDLRKLSLYFVSKEDQFPYLSRICAKKFRLLSGNFKRYCQKSLFHCQRIFFRQNFSLIKLIFVFRSLRKRMWNLKWILSECVSELLPSCPLEIFVGKKDTT